MTTKNNAHRRRGGPALKTFILAMEAILRSKMCATISCTIFVTSLQTFAAQTIPDVDRIQRGLLRDIPPTSIEELAQGADVVVRARLVKARTFLQNEIYITTEYEIVSPEVISGALAAVASTKPGPASPLVLGLFGGEMTINGQTIRAVDHAMATEVTSGREYLLFLRRFGTDPRQYQVYRGGIFEIEGNQAKALAQGPEAVFKGTSQAPVTELIDRVRGQGKIAPR